MTITSSLRFLYIIGSSGPLCAGTKKFLSINDITFDWFAVSQLVKNIVDGRNFVLPSYSGIIEET